MSLTPLLVGVKRSLPACPRPARKSRALSGRFLMIPKQTASKPMSDASRDKDGSLGRGPAVRRSLIEHIQHGQIVLAVAV